jgi:predicted O-linked N-acetylglucosamine transferase (SPINDLY family)
MQPNARCEQLLQQARTARSQGRLDQAAALLARAEQAQRGGAAVLAERAHLLHARGRYPEAFQQIRQALAARPNQPDDYLLLGNIFRDSGHAQEARDCYGACLELSPGMVGAMICLGNLARDQRQTGEARRWYERALQAKPGDPNVQTNLASILCDTGRTGEAIGLLESSLRTRPAALTHSNLLLTLHYDSHTAPERIASEQRAWAALYAQAIRRLPLRNDWSTARRLRLGFVSADLKQHPVGRLVEALWRHLDREQFEVVAYDAGTRQDGLSETLRTLADRWQSLQGLPDAEAAQLIRDDAVDVLLDLSGHTAGNRLLVFAHKPAPMQATWFAYPNSTGLDAIDWRLTDALSDPPGESESRYAEKLLRLGHAPWLYRAPEEPLPIRPLPHLRGEPFTFGCLNNPAKTSEASLAAWIAMLRLCPQARLLLLTRDDEDYQQQLRRRFALQGVAESQLLLVVSGTPHQFYEYHYHVDLLLDPFPYNGAVTTCDALWMGVPVLSLAGSSYVSRQGVCVLSLLGLSDWLCATPQEYVQRAVTLAQAPAALAAASPGLRARLQNSPFMDYPQFAREFASAIRSAWQESARTAASSPPKPATPAAARPS